MTTERLPHPKQPDDNYVGDYTILTPEMVSGTLGSISQRYTGTETHLIIDDSFPNNNLTNLFNSNQTLESLVISTNKFTDMASMFAMFKAGTLDLTSFDTSNVTNMGSMFKDSQVTSLDLSSFDTSNVTYMGSMFLGSKATTLDLSSFDTSNVTYMGSMFLGSKATTLDLSSFDTSKVTDMGGMFFNSQVTTGYARTQADADRFNASAGKPEGLTFVVRI